MDYIVTDAGIKAAFAAGSHGPKIEVMTVRFGSGFGYTATSSATGFVGAEVHATPISGYSVIDDNTCEFVAVLNPDVGDFNFGEVGLFLSDGSMFALGVTDKQQAKIARPNAGWNKVRIRVRVSLSQLPALINWKFINITAGIIIELPDWSSVDAPDAMDSNCYIVHQEDDGGNTPFIVRDNLGGWSVSTHERQLMTNKIIGGSGTTLRLESNQDVLSGSYPLGRYLLQVLSGSQEGKVIPALSFTENEIVVLGPVTIPEVGSEIEVLQSNVSYGRGRIAKYPVVPPYAVTAKDNGRLLCVLSPGRLTFGLPGTYPDDFEVRFVNMSTGDVTLEGSTFYDTGSDDSSTGADTTPPSTPVLSLSSLTAHQASLSWTAASDNMGVAGYVVNRDGTDLPLQTLQYINDSVVPGSNHVYRVRAKDASGNFSTYSNSVSVAVPVVVPTNDVYYWAAQVGEDSGGNSTLVWNEGQNTGIRIENGSPGSTVTQTSHWSSVPWVADAVNHVTLDSNGHWDNGRANATLGLYGHHVHTWQFQDGSVVTKNLYMKPATPDPQFRALGFDSNNRIAVGQPYQYSIVGGPPNSSATYHDVWSETGLESNVSIPLDQYGCWLSSVTNMDNMPGTHAVTLTFGSGQTLHFNFNVTGNGANIIVNGWPTESSYLAGASIVTHIVGAAPNMAFTYTDTNTTTGQVTTVNGFANENGEFNSSGTVPPSIGQHTVVYQFAGGQTKTFNTTIVSGATIPLTGANVNTTSVVDDSGLSIGNVLSGSATASPAPSNATDVTYQWEHVSGFVFGTVPRDQPTLSLHYTVPSSTPGARTGVYRCRVSQGATSFYTENVTFHFSWSNL